MKEQAGTVLVIDDEDIVRSMICDMLSGMGYDIIDFSDPVSAVEHYRRSFQGIALVLIDMTMSKLNGRETFFLLKKINPGVRTIIISGSGMNEDIENILKEGNIRFLKKPLNFNQLKDSIEKVISPDVILNEQIQLSGPVKNSAFNGYHFENAITRLGGRRDIFSKGIRSFIEKYRMAGDEMRRCLYSGNPDDLTIYAHSMRTVAASLGIMNLEERAETIEISNGISERTVVEDLINEFEVQLRTVMTDLAVFLDQDHKAENVSIMSEIKKGNLRKVIAELKKYADLSRPLQCRMIYNSDLQNVTCCGFGDEQKEIIVKMLDKYDFTGLSDYLSVLIKTSKGDSDEKTV